MGWDLRPPNIRIEYTQRIKMQVRLPVGIRNLEAHPIIPTRAAHSLCWPHHVAFLEASTLKNLVGPREGGRNFNVGWMTWQYGKWLVLFLLLVSRESVEAYPKWVGVGPHHHSTTFGTNSDKIFVFKLWRLHSNIFYFRLINLYSYGFGSLISFKS